LGFICLESLLLLLQAQNLRFAMTQNSHLSSDLPQSNLPAKKNSLPQLKEYGGGDGIMIPQTAPALLSLNKKSFLQKTSAKRNGGDDGIMFPQNIPALLSLNKTYFCKKPQLIKDGGNGIMIPD
jgi:hypothetical protein